MTLPQQEEGMVVKYEGNKPVGAPATLSQLLERADIQAKLAAVVPKHMNPKRLAKMALLAASRQPELLKCTQGSILQAVMTAAELGLDCSGTLGSGYLVPYFNKKIGAQEAVFIAGYRGLIDLARRSGDIKSISARVVYKQDVFELEQGLEEKLVHRPALDNDRKDEDITGAYVVAHFKDGGTHLEWMGRVEIDKIRSRSKAGDFGPWKSDYPEMCKKTVVRRAVKYLPISIEAAQLIAEADTEIEFPAKPEVATATLTLDEIQPGNIEDHTPVDAPLFKQEVPEPELPKSCLEIWEAFMKANKLKPKIANHICDVEMVKRFATDDPRTLSNEMANDFQRWLDGLDLSRM